LELPEPTELTELMALMVQILLFLDLLEPTVPMALTVLMA
jgi:hypothetical protein